MMHGQTNIKSIFFIERQGRVASTPEFYSLSIPNLVDSHLVVSKLKIEAASFLGCHTASTVK
jgi:hypothetical protein